MIRLTTVAEERLRNSGWYPGRNIFDDLALSDHKELFDESIKLLGEFGLLKVPFKGKTQNEEEILYFDVDESIASKTLRAKMFGFESHNNLMLKNEPDFIETEDYELIDKVISAINEPCTRIATKEDALGFDIYVTFNGSIYIAHHDVAEKRADSFYEYLNKIIVG